MKKMSVAEYAKATGKTPQGIYYLIKQGQLKTLSEDGKTFVLVKADDKNLLNNFNNHFNKQSQANDTPLKDTLLKEKDKRIDQLERELEETRKNFGMVVATLESKVKLLQDAYHTEVKNRHHHQVLEHKEAPFKETIPVDSFVKMLRKKGRSLQEVKHIIVAALIDGDERFYFDGETLSIKRDPFYDLAP